MTIETHRVLGRTGVQVTPLTLGTMNFGRWQDESESVRIIGAAIDAGITPIDTADVYAKGASEEIVAKAIKGRRDEVFLATKFHGQIGTDPRSGGELAAMDHRGGRGKFASALAAADALAALAEDNGLTLVELSIAFALNHPAISTVIIGPRTH
ncbi:MAG: yhdN 3, partial [Mycobacterium sp.]|nr:yhdN 3 [Mycobacterium sp.]